MLDFYESDLSVSCGDLVWYEIHIDSRVTGLHAHIHHKIAKHLALNGWLVTPSDQLHNIPILLPHSWCTEAHLKVTNKSKSQQEKRLQIP